MFAPPSVLDLTVSCQRELDIVRNSVVRDQRMLLPMVQNNFELAAMGISCLVDVRPLSFAIHVLMLTCIPDSNEYTSPEGC